MTDKMTLEEYTAMLLAENAKRLGVDPYKDGTIQGEPFNDADYKPDASDQIVNSKSDLANMVRILTMQRDQARAENERLTLENDLENDRACALRADTHDDCGDPGCCPDNPAPLPKSEVLVERLRKAAVEPCDGCCYGETMVEAADEIERLSAAHAKLKAENERLTKELDDYRGCIHVMEQNDTLRAENERLTVMWTDRETEHLNRIEELCAEVKMLQDAVGGYVIECAQLRAENERLKADLEICQAGNCSNYAEIDRLRKELEEHNRFWKAEGE